MSTLKKLSMKAVAAMNQAQEVASNLPPSSHESIDAIYKHFDEQGAIFRKVFPSQRALKNYLVEEDVNVWGRSLDKGESIKPEGDPRETKNVIIYAKFFVHAEEAVAALEKKFTLYGQQHAKDSKSSYRALKDRLPSPVETVQKALNASRLRVVQGTSKAKLMGEDKETFIGIEKAQKDLEKLKTKLSKLSTHHHLKDPKRREAFINKNYKQMMEAFKASNLLEIAGLIPDDYSVDTYLSDEWKY